MKVEMKKSKIDKEGNISIYIYSLENIKIAS